MRNALQGMAKLLPRANCLSGANGAGGNNSGSNQTTNASSVEMAVEYIKSLHDYPTKYRELRGLLGTIYPYFLTYAILERYADIRRALRPPHGPGLIGDIDTLIAALSVINARNQAMATNESV